MIFCKTFFCSWNFGQYSIFRVFPMNGISYFSGGGHKATFFLVQPLRIKDIVLCGMYAYLLGKRNRPRLSSASYTRRRARHDDLAAWLERGIQRSLRGEMKKKREYLLRRMYFLRGKWGGKENLVSNGYMALQKYIKWKMNKKVYKEKV